MNFKSKILYIAAFTAIVGSGCSKDFLDINTNPNALPTATPSFVFTNALNSVSNNLLSPNELGSYWAGQWTQSNGYILNTQQFSYMYTNGDFNYWDGLYDNLEDFQYVINTAAANSQNYLKGPSMIMKAMIYQYLVDMYGNIPYTDALKGVSSLAPKFDDQKAIYEDLIKVLDTAIVTTKANEFAGAFVGADIVFKGSTTKWVQLANSLKLRLLIHQSRVAGRGSYITAEINKIVTEGTGFITTYDAGINPGFTASAGKLNPIYDRWGYDANGTKRALSNYPRLTEYLVNTLKNTSDTFRLKRIGYANGGENANTPGVSTRAEIAANYAGIPFGASAGYLPSAASALGPSLIVRGVFNKDFIIFPATEALFLLAEAKERYGSSVTLPGTAQSYYEAAITQSFRLLGADVTKAPLLYGSGNPATDYAASTNKLATIATEKWLSLANFMGLEAWTEYRRTNFPATPQSLNATGANRPLRLFYPNTESGSNEANVKLQGNIDVFATRLFWDVD